MGRIECNNPCRVSKAISARLASRKGEENEKCIRCSCVVHVTNNYLSDKASCGHGE